MSRIGSRATTRNINKANNAEKDKETTEDPSLVASNLAGR